MAFIRNTVGRWPVQSLIRGSATIRARRFQGREPLSEQQAIFRQLVTQGSGTLFGREHGFQSLAHLPFHQAYAQFQRQVPIRTYQDFWNDYFKAGCHPDNNGNTRISLENITWPGKIRMFCETSGTTAPTKYIPFSEQMFAENRRAATDMISCYLAARSGSRISSGKILYMSGSTELNDMGDDICSGDMSAITLRFRPKWLAPFVEPQGSVSSLPWEEKLQAMAELLVNDRDIRVISGVPPWIILLLKRCVELGRRPLAELLPHLELIIHGGTSIKPYRSEFEALFDGRLPDLLELLPSSEAFMAFQQPGDDYMRLTPYYGVFFEFVRFEDLDGAGRPAKDAVAIPLEQVQVGQRYAVILTTCSGLWRYHIGDTIRFVSREPCFIEFTGRDRFLDKLEEKVTQGEVERAIAELNGCGSWNVQEFMVGADVESRRHVWVLATAGADNNAEQAALLLDNALCGMNADYAAFRSQGRIKPPLMLVTREEMIYEWSRTVRGKLGGQSKIPHIDPTTDSSMIASLREFVGQG